MANHNNLIRPPVLNAPPPPLLQPRPELMDLVRDAVARMMVTDRRNMIRGIINTNNNPPPVVDQIIEERYRDNIADIEKVPDIVKSLRECTGKPEEFSSWKKSVKRILKIYYTPK